jgi:catechol 2,3-dioxygenase-like lactoylglutathione lyase family enzyme
MTPQLVLEKVNHVNQVLRDYDEAIRFYQTIFGARLTFDARSRFGPYNNCILRVGTHPGVIIELFSPTDGTGLGKIVDRYGDTWQGVEFKVPRLDEALRAVTSRELRIVDHNPGHWFFTLPSDCHGLCLELVETQFSDDAAESNPLGIVGLREIGVACPSATAAGEFFTELVGNAEVRYRRSSQRLGADIVGVATAGIVIEFLSPTGPGPIASFLQRYRPQQRSITLAVESLERAGAHLAAAGVATIPGDDDDRFAIDPDHNYGVLYQFAQVP